MTNQQIKTCNNIKHTDYPGNANSWSINRKYANLIADSNKNNNNKKILFHISWELRMFTISVCNGIYGGR